MILVHLVDLVVLVQDVFGPGGDPFGGPGGPVGFGDPFGGPGWFWSRGDPGGLW